VDCRLIVEKGRGLTAKAVLMFHRQLRKHTKLSM
jgi:hypothetical protein